MISKLLRQVVCIFMSLGPWFGSGKWPGMIDQCRPCSDYKAQYWCENDFKITVLKYMPFAFHNFVNI